MNHVIPLLRAARFLLGSSQAEIGAALAIKAKTIQLIEGGKYKLLPREVWILHGHYQETGIEFTQPSNGCGHGVRWRKAGIVLEGKDPDHFGGGLIRAARGLADISQRELAMVAAVDPSFVARLEKNRYGAVNQDALAKLVSGLLTYNVEMMSGTTTHGAGVRWVIDPKHPVVSEPASDHNES
ncbi:transcriptional regulator, y4mF family [Agrobacterium sp. DSM 25558]|uniref:helix-turn-helix domain-containing protein n=1 Tax=Agrobacterium sp. DSM 25558 TaxID=1907665 RepID=UPI00097240D0|nr:helix-turn-helix domain-containing protein [Agrobacterium sp. DSM 25558]SCX28104.1 transcriptional regulator, y4mF family [Agrobacterium sp. DSM 25558]